MKRKPLRQQHDLDRHHRHAAPRQHAVEREQRACEYVRARRAAARQNGLARASHVGRLRIVADHPEREIRLHARAHVERAVVKERPAAVRALDATQILRDLGLEHGIDRLAAVMPQQDIFGGNRGVGFQLEHPMPVGLLAIEQRRRRMRDAAIERVHATDGHSLLAGTQPSLRKDALLHPSPECDVMEPEAQHAGVQIQKLFLGKLRNDICALRIPADGALIFLNDACSRLPVHVLWRVKHRVTLHRSPVYSIDGNRWSF